ncbi:MAG: DUF1080 domain-containing protein [Saprospiraceae bacterium]|nr:DUF1080 domain-containing protein [Saprospiraceae bacterium]
MIKSAIAKTYHFLSFILIICICWISACVQGDKPPTQNQLLPEGWEGNADYFRLENDIIIAGHLNQAIPNNEFLCTDKSYDNFEIRLKAKLTGEGKNAGIQIRSARIPNHFEVIGYQCDMGETEDRLIWGSLYDESRRKLFLAHPPAEEVSKAFKKGDWNEFVIKAEGPRIQIWLNGYQTIDYTETEENINQTGSICLQIHSGPPAEAWYKDIEIKELGGM